MLIVIAGENRLAKDSLISSLSELFREPAVSSNSLQDVFEVIRRTDADALVLLDYEMGAPSQTLREMRSDGDRVHRVAVYGGPGCPDEAMRCLSQGYDGYLPRSMSASAIVCAVQLMMRGERFVPSVTIDGVLRASPDNRIQVPALSPRQSEILAMVATGASNKHIARALRVEEVTVKSHVKAIFRKLGVHTRTEAARFILTGAQHPRSMPLGA